MNGNGPAKNQSLQRNLSFVVLSLLAFACAQATNAPLVTTCQLPADQATKNSAGYYVDLLGYWSLKPVPIAFHAGDFSASEMATMTSAADTWNRFFGQTQKFSIIDYGTAANPRTSGNAKPSGPCTQGITGTQYSAPVVIYKDSSNWPYGSTAIALTRTCASKSDPVPLGHFTMAYIEVNYQNYFVAGQKNPDLQSILLHELGHLTGLDHSCESATAGFPDCASSPAAYTDAVMAPIFTFDTNGNGQQKRGLTANDEGRANCLYDGGVNNTTTK